MGINVKAYQMGAWCPTITHYIVPHFDRLTRYQLK